MRRSKRRAPRAPPSPRALREDIDAIFALLRDHLINLDVATPSALEAAVRDALKGYQLPVVVKHVDATRDYTGFYAKHIDSGLKNFSYSENTNGYHVFSAEPTGVTGEPPRCAFKKYQVRPTCEPRACAPLARARGQNHRARAVAARARAAR